MRLKNIITQTLLRVEKKLEHPNVPERTEQTPLATKPTQERRVGKAERDEVVNTLADAYADERLSAAEHDERLQKALEAKTKTELDALVVDLSFKLNEEKMGKLERSSAHKPSSQPKTQKSKQLVAISPILVQKGTLSRGSVVGPSRRLQTVADDAAISGRLAYLPVGSFEQHGPHLPLSTDALIASHQPSLNA